MVTKNPSFPARPIGAAEVSRSAQPALQTAHVKVSREAVVGWGGRVYRIPVLVRGYADQAGKPAEQERYLTARRPKGGHAGLLSPLKDLWGERGDFAQSSLRMGTPAIWKNRKLNYSPTGFSATGRTCSELKRSSPALPWIDGFKTRGEAMAKSKFKPKGGECTDLSTSVDSQPELFDDCGVPQENKTKVWFVVMSRADFSEDLTKAPTFHREWRWAHTKSWARELARRARAEGWNIVDIFPGTKAHITHKYRGLK